MSTLTPTMQGIKPPRIVIIDNYDSYAYNLFQLLGELTGTMATVFRNDQVTCEQVAALEPTHLVISPGPGNPEDPAYFGVCKDVILNLGRRIPLLGVCLGHQGIAHAFGGRVVRAPMVMHGKTSQIRHNGQLLFNGVKNPFTAMRYHSLIVDPATLPRELRPTAWTDDGIIMGVAHETYPIWGVQFHPESIGTPVGLQILANFLTGGRSGGQVELHPEFLSHVFRRPRSPS